jgi:hypothetical protein
MANVNTEDIKRGFDRDGFVILPGYLSASELAELATRAVTCIDQMHDGNSDKSIIKGLNNHDRWFQDQLERGKHLNLMEALTEDKVIPATAAWFNKPAGESSVLKPHFDAIGSPRVPRSGCTLWIALDRADQDNGCLYYARGSHRSRHDESAIYLDYDTDSDDAIAVVAEPGDAIIHSALTIHWSGQNRSARSRRAISYFYWGASSKIDPAAEKAWKVK